MEGIFINSAVEHDKKLHGNEISFSLITTTCLSQVR